MAKAFDKLLLGLLPFNGMTEGMITMLGMQGTRGPAVLRFGICPDWHHVYSTDCHTWHDPNAVEYSRAVETYYCDSMKCCD